MERDMYVSWSPASAQATSNLSAAQTSLQKTQQQESTGKSVNNASDNLALWAMATANYSQSDAVDAVTSSQQALTTPLLSTTLSAVGSISDTLDAMRNNLIALQGGGDQTAILQSLQAQGQALNSAVSGAGLNGVNLLNGSTGAQGSNFLLGYSENSQSAQTTSVNVGDGNLVNGAGSGVFQTAQAASSNQATNFTALTASDLSPANISQTLANLNAAQAQLETVGGNFGASSTLVSQSIAANVASRDDLANAAASMDNADMGQVAMQLSAGQVQQQLAVLSQGIANRSSGAVLRLFQQSGG